jgi:hypothetical protein
VPTFAGCTASVKDEGKWGDLVEGGDVNKLHDAGTYCASWSPSDYSPGPVCKSESVCTQWVRNAFPPFYMSDDGNLCNGPGTPRCELFDSGPPFPKCNPGQAGDAYCKAYYAAWMQPGVTVNAKCWDGTCSGLENDYPCQRCYVECGATMHGPSGAFYDPPGTCPGPDGLSMCVLAHDGSIACQELCSDTPSGPPAKP